MTWKCYAEAMRPAGASIVSDGVRTSNPVSPSERAEIEVGSVSILSAYRIYLQIVQVIIAIALTVAILLQARGAGLGSVFGGTGAVFKTRRGIDKMLFRTTIVLAVLFGALSLLVAAIPEGS